MEPYRGAIAKTFWGRAWCDNLEHYSDYANRLPRGRSYVRNGSVIDLKLAPGEVRAQVMGSRLYRVEVTIGAVADAHWRSIGADCAGSIDSLIELLQGKLDKGVMARICAQGKGLFPTPKEIRFSCSCPDSAAMCKHVAAVLYGVGARLDQNPELLFALRRVDAGDLVALASIAQPKVDDATAADKVLDDSALADMFGIEMVDSASPLSPPQRSPAKPATKAKAATAPAKKPPKATKAPSGKAAKAPKVAKSPSATKVKAGAGSPKPAAKIRAPATSEARAKAKRGKQLNPA